MSVAADRDLMLEEVARQIAGQRLMGTGYVLRRGKTLRSLEGWRFPVRKIDDPDTLADDEPMVVTLLIRFEEVEDIDQLLR